MKYHHTWYEGIQVCKARSQSKAVVGNQLNGAQQKGIDSSQGTDMANGEKVIAATKTFAFTLVNTSSRSMFDTKSIATTTFTPDKLLTTTPAHLLMTNTPRSYSKVSSSNKSAIPSSSIRECMGLLTSILHVNFLIMFVS